jgi:hypothetical protein
MKQALIRASLILVFLTAGCATQLVEKRGVGRPPAANALYKRGRAARKRRPDEAIRLFRRALARDPEHEDALLTIGITLAR